MEIESKSSRRVYLYFFFSSRRRHTRFDCDWSSDVCSSDLPGISLKSEVIGWASMAEMPLIICNIQRGGPSTGLPTNVEQSDLHQAIFGSHEIGRASCRERV